MVILAVYLITCESYRQKNYDQINERISKLGDYIRPLSSVWLVNTTLSFNELYNHINAFVERNDMFYITSISSAGIGRLDMEDTNWIKNKFFIPVTPLAPTGNTKGPLSIQQPAPVQKRSTVVQKSTPARRQGSSTGRQRYPEMPWD